MTLANIKAQKCKNFIFKSQNTINLLMSIGSSQFVIAFQNTHVLDGHPIKSTIKRTRQKNRDKRTGTNHQNTYTLLYILYISSSSDLSHLLSTPLLLLLLLPPLKPSPSSHHSLLTPLPSHITSFSHHSLLTSSYSYQYYTSHI